MFLSIDHNHVNNKVRGLLCSNCNCAIGLLGDSPVIINRALEYLQEAETSDTLSEVIGQ